MDATEKLCAKLLARSMWRRASAHRKAAEESRDGPVITAHGHTAMILEQQVVQLMDEFDLNAEDVNVQPRPLLRNTDPFEEVDFRKSEE